MFLLIKSLPFFLLLTACSLLQLGSEKETDKIKVTAIELDKSRTSILVGESYQLLTTIKPVEVEAQTLIWSTQDSGIVTVDDSGVIYGVAEGSCTITVTTENEEISDSLTIEVVIDSVSVTGIDFDDTPILLAKNQTHQLLASVKPENATNTIIEWSSGDSAIVTVDSSGLLSGVSTGSAIITATTQDGSFTDSVEVNVYIPVESVELTADQISIYESQTYQLFPTLNPTDATNQNLLWSSSNSAVVSVDASGLLTGISSTIDGGIAYITVTSEDGSKKDTVRVSVTEYIPLTGFNPGYSTVNLDPNRNTGSTVNSGFLVSYAPENASNKKLNVTVADSSIVHAYFDSEDNHVWYFAIAPGTTTVSISSDCNPVVSKEITVNVGPDTDKPFLDEIDKISNKSLVLSFPERMSDTGLTTIGNYSLNSSSTGALNIVSVENLTSSDPWEFTQVIITVDEEFITDDTLVLEVNNLEDISGNSIDLLNNSLSLLILEPLPFTIDYTKITESNGTLKLKAGAVDLGSTGKYDPNSFMVFAQMNTTFFDISKPGAGAAINSDGSSTLFMNRGEVFVFEDGVCSLFLAAEYHADGDFTTDGRMNISTEPVLFTVTSK